MLKKAGAATSAGLFEYPEAATGREWRALEKLLLLFSKRLASRDASFDRIRLFRNFRIVPFPLALRYAIMRMDR
jgi:hypothetical protein